MTDYFDRIESEIRDVSEEARRLNGGDDDLFLEQLGRIEGEVAHAALLNSGDREFPDDLREKVTGAIALHATRDLNGCGLGEQFYTKPRARALATRRSRLVAELHEVFHELAGRRLVSRFGPWTDDPAANLKSRDLKIRGGPIRVTDADALDKIASVEGESWKADSSTRESPYTFKGVLALWRKRMEETRGRRGVSATIYGAGGWNRWHVLPENGEIVFSRSHGHPGDDKRAEAAGFRVI